MNHILLLADRHPGSQGAIDFAIGLAEPFNAQLTLMHGGNLRSDPAFWTSDSLETPDPNQVRLALLGLLWAIRKRCPEVGLCRVSARLPEQVFQAAAQHGVDLLVLPAGLFGRFLPMVGGAVRMKWLRVRPAPFWWWKVTRCHGWPTQGRRGRFTAAERKFGGTGRCRILLTPAFFHYKTGGS
jgi:nucleotide-binding universal stress UspA family protein